MAILFPDSAVNDLERSTNLPNNQFFSCCFWFYPIDNTTGWQTMFSIEGGSGTWFEAENLAMDVFTEGTGFSCGSLNLNEWNFLSLTARRDGGGGTNEVKVYTYIGGTWNSYSSTVSSSAGAFTKFVIGYDYDFAQPLDGRMCNFKLWSHNTAAGAVLSQAEIQAEAFIMRPVRTSNLLYWLPMFPGSGERNRDYSGNGYDFTVVGTLTDADPVNISYGGQSLIIPYASTAAIKFRRSISQRIGSRPRP